MNEREQGSAAAGRPHRPVPATTTPGALYTTATLTLHTEQAARLLRGLQPGEPERTAFGLNEFNTRLRVLLVGARRGDPYGEWWLVKTEEAIAAAEAIVNEAQETVTARLNRCSHFAVVPAAASKPTRVPLRFSNAYSFAAVRLIAAFDALACSSQSAAHLGVMTPEEITTEFARCRRAIRRLYLLPGGYRFLGITRHDLTAGNARAELARSLMGEVPAEILSGERRALHLPRGAARKSAIADHVTLHAATAPSDHPLTTAIAVEPDGGDGTDTPDRNP